VLSTQRFARAGHPNQGKGAIGRIAHAFIQASSLIRRDYSGLRRKR
jgi:hypothetical protein